MKTNHGFHGFHGFRTQNFERGTRNLAAALLILAATGCTTISVETPDGLHIRYSSSKDITVEKHGADFTVKANASTPAAAFADGAVRIFEAGAKAGAQ